MFKRRYFIVLLLAIVAAVALSACAAPEENSKTDIAAAVEATLTMVAKDSGSAITILDDDSPATIVPVAVQAEKVSDSNNAASTNIVLPPLVADFNPAARPGSSRGDPDAPLVMYEWSDYT